MTRFHVDGADNHSDEGVAEGVVHIRPDYSRDHRPDLNQVVLPLITENQAGILWLMATSSGNTNDQAGLRALGQRHIEHLPLEVGLQYLGADSALYREGSLRE